MSEDYQVGKIGWIDSTVDDATALRDFYRQVVGWKSDEVSISEYADYSMAILAMNDVVTGTCHTRGSNADLNVGWLNYVTVEDAHASAAACRAQGGKVVVEPRGFAGGQFCVIQDSSGAKAVLCQA